jgi:hypothetical protein
MTTAYENRPLNDKLTSALTEYDRKQSTKRGYNHYALAIYFGALAEAQEEIDKGVEPSKALANNFNDRLLAALLKVL